MVVSFVIFFESVCINVGCGRFGIGQRDRVSLFGMVLNSEVCSSFSILAGGEEIWIFFAMSVRLSGLGKRRMSWMQRGPDLA